MADALGLFPAGREGYRDEMAERMNRIREAIAKARLSGQAPTGVGGAPLAVEQLAKMADVLAAPQPQGNDVDRMRAMEAFARRMQDFPNNIPPEERAADINAGEASMVAKDPDYAASLARRRAMDTDAGNMAQYGLPSYTTPQARVGAGMAPGPYQYGFGTGGPENQDAARIAAEAVGAQEGRDMGRPGLPGQATPYGLTQRPSGIDRTGLGRRMGALALMDFERAEAEPPRRRLTQEEAKAELQRIRDSRESGMTPMQEEQVAVRTRQEMEAAEQGTTREEMLAGNRAKYLEKRRAAKESRESAMPDMATRQANVQMKAQMGRPAYLAQQQLARMQPGMAGLGGGGFGEAAMAGMMFGQGGFEAALRAQGTNAALMQDALQHRASLEVEKQQIEATKETANAQLELARIQGDQRAAAEAADRKAQAEAAQAAKETEIRQHEERMAALAASEAGEERRFQAGEVSGERQHQERLAAAKAEQQQQEANTGLAADEMERQEAATILELLESNPGGIGAYKGGWENVDEVVRNEAIMSILDKHSNSLSDAMPELRRVGLDQYVGGMEIPLREKFGPNLPFFPGPGFFKDFPETIERYKAGVNYAPWNIFGLGQATGR